MMKHFLMMMLLPICLSGQVTRMFEFQPDGTDQVNRLSMLFQTPGVKLIADPVIGVVSIVGDTEEKVNAAEQFFKTHYKPKPRAVADKNVELTMTVLYGKAGADGAGDLPAAMASVVHQLKQLTNLKTFQVVDTQVSRVRNGKKAESTGVLNGIDTPVGYPAIYQSTFEVRVLNGVVKMDTLRFSVKLPFKAGENSYNYREAIIFSSLDFNPGQQVVVGKTNTSTQDGALILVVSAKLVD